ncbi:MAG: radical SAM protein, partial [Bacteroidales bacterium]|nr:radical SAM protein [Bacteroidales bacterium]
QCFFDLPEKKIISIVRNFIDNKKELNIEYEGKYYSFPKNVIVKNKTEMVRDYKPENFVIEVEDLDYESSRLYSPVDALYVVNTNCITDCIYCYANKSYNYSPITFENLSAIIKEAREIGMRNIDISGGELFLSENWDKIVFELLDNGFKPYISTKVPIGKRQIQKLKDIGITEIQISIDSMNQDVLSRILNVDRNYHSRIIETLKKLDAEGFVIKTNTIITNLNSSKKGITELLEFLASLKNIRHINLSPVGYSIYKTDFELFKPKVEDLKKISELVEKIKRGRNIFGIDFNPYLSSELVNGEFRIKDQYFAKRAKCTGNIENFIILPDGKVTICEELYWHPAFIIGDLTKQTIMEVWNSDKALSLQKLSQNKIQEKSACKSCNDFKSCRNMPGVCWKFIIEAYGAENWDFPDPRCPLAPKPETAFCY